MADQLAEYRWLISDDARPWLMQTMDRRESGQDFLTIAKWLRKQFTPQRSALILELVQTRNRGIRKFELADQMFFTRAALEMATDQWIAKYKAQRFQRFQAVADVCCSIGGDLIAIASSLGSGRCIGYDNDPLAVLYANANLTIHGISNAQAMESSLAEFPLRDHDAVHIDPERRKQGRSTRGTEFSPALNEIFDRLTAGGAAGIKVAPATRLRDNLGSLERQWIGRRRECQQQMVWCGELAQHPGCRVATRLGKSGSITSFALKEEEIAARKVGAARTIQRYVYEPHSVLLAAGMADAMASQFDLEKIAPDIFYFTSDSRIKNRLFSRFKVAQSMRANLTQVARAVQDAGYGDLEIKNRGINQSVAEKYKRIRLTGVGRGTLLLCPFGGNATAIIAARETSS